MLIKVQNTQKENILVNPAYVVTMSIETEIGFRGKTKWKVANATLSNGISLDLTEKSFNKLKKAVGKI